MINTNLKVVCTPNNGIRTGTPN